MSFFLTESDFLDFLVNYLRCTTCSYLQDAHSSLFESQGEINSKFLWSISEKIDFSYVKRFNSHREKWFKITFRFTMIFRPLPRDYLYLIFIFSTGIPSKKLPVKPGTIIFTWMDDCDWLLSVEKGWKYFSSQKVTVSKSKSFIDWLKLIVNIKK